jgi:hypothetical protein
VFTHFAQPPGFPSAESLITRAVPTEVRNYNMLIHSGMGKAAGDLNHLRRHAICKNSQSNYKSLESGLWRRGCRARLTRAGGRWDRSMDLLFESEPFDSSHQCGRLEPQQLRGAARTVNLPFSAIERCQNIVALTLPKFDVA